MRKEIWGYDPDETLDNAALIKEKYRGIRPAAGYPSQPDHTEKQLIWDLLDAEKNTGATLTSSYAMTPAPPSAASTSATPKPNTSKSAPSTRTRCRTTPPAKASAWKSARSGSPRTGGIDHRVQS